MPSRDRTTTTDLRVGLRKHIVIAYAGGGLRDVGDIVTLPPQARNDLPLHALVG